MMRCEHVVEKRLPLTRRTRLRACRHKLKSVSRRRIMGLTWHCYRCKFGHETRLYVQIRD